MPITCQVGFVSSQGDDDVGRCLALKLFYPFFSATKGVWFGDVVNDDGGLSIEGE